MNNEAENSDNLDLIVRELAGETTPEESARLKAWIEKDPANLNIYNEYRKVWLDMDKVKGKTSADVDFEWQRLEKAIDAEPVVTLKKRQTSMPFIRIAASLIILTTVGAGIFYLLNSDGSREVIAENKIEQVRMPEGSVVSLNMDSRLTYSKKFDANVREIELVGEAFFEVAIDTLRPFLIKSGDIYIEVLGTSFNVKANEEDENVEVTVESGKVAVYRSDRIEEKVILVKGQKAIFRKSSGDIVMTGNDNVNFKAWKTKKIIFEDTPMSEVVKIVNEIYRSDLQLVNDQLANCPVTTAFDNESLETILKVLSSTLDLSIKRNGKVIEISGAGC